MSDQIEPVELEGSSLDNPATVVENRGNSLDSSPAVAEGPSTSTLVQSSQQETAASPSSQASPKLWRRIIARVNVYLLLLVIILLVSITIIMAAYLNSKHASSKANLTSQNLSASTLAQLANSDATVGNVNQILNIESSAIFAGKVLIRQGLDVAGNLNIGGALSLNNLTVSGTSQFGQAQINKDLQVAGNTSLQGAVTIAKNLQVNGGGNFSGPISAPQITASSLQLNGDLILTHHITTGGSLPSHAGDNALGIGGTSSISGSDTAGTININTGSNTAAGCFVKVNFAAHYASTPHILLTPIGSSAGGLSYYVNRTANGFSVCDATVPPAGSSFGFDYFVIN